MDLDRYFMTPTGVEIDFNTEYFVFKAKLQKLKELYELQKLEELQKLKELQKFEQFNNNYFNFTRIFRE